MPGSATSGSSLTSQSSPSAVAPWLQGTLWRWVCRVGVMVMVEVQGLGFRVKSVQGAGVTFRHRQRNLGGALVLVTSGGQAVAANICVLQSLLA